MRIEDAVYIGKHAGFFITSALGQRLLAKVAKVEGRVTTKPDPRVVRTLRKRFLTMLRTDLENARVGLYPYSVLRESLPPRYIKQVPLFVREIARSIHRRRENRFLDLPLSPSEKAQYPSYYARNFHWQSDGYFSDSSAALYDIGVDFLFLGLADAMRRQILIPLKKRFQAKPDSSLLDVGCGTGRLLRQISLAFPASHLKGVDLSPNYAFQSLSGLSSHPRAEIIAANAEKLPYEDASLDIVTCVYLMHELPHRVRRNVLQEARRVLRPDGVLILMDSLQQDSTELLPVLRQFSEDFHEPFYNEYLTDLLEDMAKECGFYTSSVSEHFVSKLVIASPMQK